MSDKQTEKTEAKNLPATVATDPEIEKFRRLGQWLALAESEGKDPASMGASAALRLYFADQLGLPPWAASQITFIRGQLGGTVELKRALARREGYDVVRVEETPTSCTAAVVDNGGKELGRATFTMDDAKKAGLIKDKGAWQQYPQRMLWARAAGWAMKDTIPEVVAGLAGEDEFEEIVEGQGRWVDEPEQDQPEATDTKEE